MKTINETKFVQTLREYSLEKREFSNNEFKSNLLKRLQENESNNFLKKLLLILSKKKYIYSILILLFLIPLITIQNITHKKDEFKKTFDWEYTSQTLLQETNRAPQINSINSNTIADSSNLGLSTGGSKDIENFRQNIENNYLPLPSDITYEGLYYDYYFPTGLNEQCNSLFCPSYSLALSPDPFTKENEYYMTVGLNSGIKESDFKRKNLNLVVVLDISGSMSAGFDIYYYDNKYPVDKSCNFEEICIKPILKTKMEVANESIVALTKRLKDQDRFGMVLFDDRAFQAKPLNKVEEVDMDKIREEILKLRPQGGTNMEAGLTKAEKLFDTTENSSDYENRIIFLTDAMPNLGNTSSDGLSSITKRLAEKNIYSTFIGIGVDFNTDLVEELTKVRGANYYSVHSAEEFNTRMDAEFEFMVTPLVFDLELFVESNAFEIISVYGSPESNLSTGRFVYVNTLFPSSTNGNQVKGGIILLKLRKTDTSQNKINLSVKYKNRDFQEFTVNKEIEWNHIEETYDNPGIRKAILLTRYANLIKNLILDQRINTGSDWVNPITSQYILTDPELSRGEWERSSMNLSITSEQKEALIDFLNYFNNEADIIQDDSLDQERQILLKLIKL